MSGADIIFIGLVLFLPILVSVRLFRTEPAGRPFIATYALAVIGSSLLFMLAALVLMLVQIGGLGPFDGIFEFIVSVPIALVVGFIIRRKRRSMAL